MSLVSLPELWPWSAAQRSPVGTQDHKIPDPDRNVDPEAVDPELLDQVGSFICALGTNAHGLAVDDVVQVVAGVADRLERRDRLAVAGVRLPQEVRMIRTAPQGLQDVRLLELARRRRVERRPD